MSPSYPSSTIRRSHRIHRIHRVHPSVPLRHREHP